jgi:hypothetical protein
MESEVPCYLCGEEVVVGDDYRIHVTIVHGVEYDLDIITSVTRGETDDEVAVGDNVTLAEDSEIHEGDDTKIDEYIEELENIHINRENEKNGKCPENNPKSFFDLFDEKLKQIRDLAEGKIEPISVADDFVEHVDDNQIWQMFENVKNKVMNMEIPEKMSSIESPENLEFSRRDDFLKWLVLGWLQPYVSLKTKMFMAF